jgi:tRNA (guanine37-N1)-methyltransferase
MRFDVISIFPGLFPGPLGDGIIARASDRGLLDLHVHDLRSYADPPHFQVDDEPFGGGRGMILKPEPLFDAVENVREQVENAGLVPGPVVLLSPQGERLDQRRARALAERAQVTLICGRYEGVDERVRRYLVDFELSIGDYVLTGGELPAMVVIEAVTRLQPEALGDAEAAQHDSFSESLLDFPQYTRPADYRGMSVPEVLRSGNHQVIAQWRRQQALLATATKRPDLLEVRGLSDEERDLLAEVTGAGREAGSASEHGVGAETPESENERSQAVVASADEAQE